MFKKYSRFYLKKYNKINKKRNKKVYDYYSLENFKFYINFKHYIIKNKKTIYNLIYNKYFFYKLPNNNSKGFLNKLFFKKRFSSILSMFKYFFIKIKFYGKSFRWIFSKKKIRFKVLKSHYTYILIKHFRFKKKKKFKIKIKTFLVSDKKYYIDKLKYIKMIDVYTKKGLRVLKTVLPKKRGKISTYM